MRTVILNKKNLRKFTAFLVCMVMILNVGILNLSANAADTYDSNISDAGENVPLFADVDENAFYYADLKFLVDSNVISSSPNSRFAPLKNISRGDFTALLVTALKLPSVVKKVNSFTDTSRHWSARYIDSAVEHGIINQTLYGKKFYPDASITRYEVAMLITNGLNIYPYDTPSLYSDVNNAYINLATSEYLISGYIEDGKNLFKPYKVLTRGDVCGIIANVIRYQRGAELYKNARILEYIKTNPIMTERQMYDFLRACTMNFVSKIDIRVNLNDSEIENAFNTYIALNPEKPAISSIDYLPDEIEWNRNLFNFNYEVSQAEDERKMREVNQVAEKFAEEYIKEGMSDVEKITEIHNYIVSTCKYDERYMGVYNISDVAVDETTIDAFTAYGGLVNKKAVCQGYSAAFNVLAEKIGIPSIAISGTPPRSSINHMWNMVCIDGTIYFIDTTWDSTTSSAVKGEINTTYLLKTEKEFLAFGYKWNPLFSKKEYLNK